MPSRELLIGAWLIMIGTSLKVIAPTDRLSAWKAAP